MSAGVQHDQWYRTLYTYVEHSPKQIPGLISRSDASENTQFQNLTRFYRLPLWEVHGKLKWRNRGGIIPHISHSYIRASRMWFQITTNKLQLFFIYLFISTDALHVSGGSSAHHQEHKTIHTASGIVNQYCC